MPERGGVHHERRAVTRLDGPHNEEKDAMPLSLVLRKLISPVEVKLVLSAFSEEMCSTSAPLRQIGRIEEGRISSSS
jgi:hypothetical protein